MRGPETTTAASFSVVAKRALGKSGPVLRIIPLMTVLTTTFPPGCVKPGGRFASACACRRGPAPPIAVFEVAAHREEGDARFLFQGGRRTEAMLKKSKTPATHKQSRLVWGGASGCEGASPTDAHPRDAEGKRHHARCTTVLRQYNNNIAGQITTNDVQATRSRRRGTPHDILHFAGPTGPAESAMMRITSSSIDIPRASASHSAKWRSISSHDAWCWAAAARKPRTISRCLFVYSQPS